MRIISLTFAALAALTLAACVTDGTGRLVEGPFCAVTNVGFGSVAENCYLPSLNACRS